MTEMARMTEMAPLENHMTEMAPLENHKLTAVGPGYKRAAAQLTHKTVVNQSYMMTELGCSLELERTHMRVRALLKCRILKIQIKYQIFTFYWCLRGAILVLLSFRLVAGRSSSGGGRLVLFSWFALLVRRSSRCRSRGVVRRLRLRGENSFNCLTWLPQKL